MKIKEIKDKKLKKHLEKIMNYGNKIGFILQKHYPMLNWRFILDNYDIKSIMGTIIKTKINEIKNKKIYNNKNEK